MPAFRPAPIRLGLVLFCLACWLPGFFTLPPGDRDESRFAEATKQMLQTGDFVRIWNGHEPRNRKPIGIYWLQAPFAAALPAFGNPVWPYRMPALLGGIAAVLATFQLGLLLTENRRTAAFAAAMLAACFVLSFETHIAKTDAALLGATAWAQYFLARAWRGRAGAGDAALFWMALGLGILIKGPITPLVSGLTAAALALTSRRGRWLLALRPAWGVPLALAIVLPWAIAIGFATHGAFFSDSLGGDLGRKLAGGQEGHGAPPGVHLLLLPLLAFPSTLPVFAAIPHAWAERRAAATSFLLAWLVPCWLVMEAVPTKLPHYTLPLYPAIFLLAASFGLRRSRLGAALLAVAGTVVAGLAIAAPILLGSPWWLGLPALPCAALIVGPGRAGRPPPAPPGAGPRAARPALALLGAIPLYAAILQWEVPRLASLWVAPRTAALLHEIPGRHPNSDDTVIAGFSEPSLMFLTGPNVLETFSGAQAAEALAKGRTLAVIESRQLPAFLAEADRRHLRVHALGDVAGFDPASGRRVRLVTYQRVG